jgi:hypothetical protein
MHLCVYQKHVFKATCLLYVPFFSRNAWWSWYVKIKAIGFALMDVGYLGVRFEYSRSRFVYKGDQIEPTVDQDRTRQALSESVIGLRWFSFWTNRGGCLAINRVFRVEGGSYGKIKQSIWKSSPSYILVHFGPLCGWIGFKNTRIGPPRYPAS